MSCRFMTTNTDIVDLDLSFNVIRADGAEHLAEVGAIFCVRIVHLFVNYPGYL